MRASKDVRPRCPGNGTPPPFEASASLRHLRVTATAKMDVEMTSGEDSLIACYFQALATDLKKRCGSGGTVDADRIEIQGDHRDTLVAELTTRGWTVRRAGG